MRLRAPAKLNLYLHVLGKREDGYHLLDSLVVFTQLADELTIEEAQDLSLQVEGEFADSAGGVGGNLVLRAARGLLAKSGKQAGAKLTLTKNIPVGAGLGGGSADAAAALRGLNRFWRLNLNQYDLRYLAATLGADVPMCLDSMPAIARGTGTELAPIFSPLPELHLLLVHPRVPLLTKDVYQALDIPPQAPVWQETLNDARRFVDALKPMRNDLQHAAIRVNSLVAEVLLALETLQPKAELVRMSGSGACCFALYLDRESAARVATAMKRHYPHWWVEVTVLKRD